MILNKMRKSIVLLLFAPLLFAVVGCQTAQQAGTVTTTTTSSTTTTTITQHTSFLSVDLGMTASEVMAALGTPYDTVTNGNRQVLSYDVTDSNGTFKMILLISDKVVKITFTSSLIYLYNVEGITTGQTLTHVQSVLGTPSSIDTSFNPLPTRYYYSNRNIYIEISTYTDKVYAIGIYDPTSSL